MNFRHFSPSLIRICRLAVAGVVLGATVSGLVMAQAPAGTGSSVSSPLLAPPAWTDLSAAQRQSLQPLAGTWNTLGDGHKRKWLAVAQNYAKLAPAEQAKMHSRMAEWAALKPKDREQARLNFAEAKKVEPAKRAANWEAYQALSPEEKQKLAEKAAGKPAGAAVTTKPLVTASKLTPVPITRRTPEEERAKITAQQQVNPNTLLPVVAP